MTDHIGHVYVENSTKLLGPIELGAIYDETWHDNNMTDHIGLVYAKNDTDLLGPIELGVVCDKTK